MTQKDDAVAGEVTKNYLKAARTYWSASTDGGHESLAAVEQFLSEDEFAQAFEVLDSAATNAKCADHNFWRAMLLVAESMNLPDHATRFQSKIIDQ
jgi:hypothetical protein